MAIRGIFFDAAGVLYRRPDSTRAHAYQLLRKEGFSTELSASDQQRRKALRGQANVGRISAEDYWDQLLVMIGVSDPEKRRRLIGQIDDYSDSVLPIPDGRETLATLKQRGFILGIVTDTIYPIERKMRWLQQVGVAEFIDTVACSTVVGVQKPDPALYLNALEQSHLAPDESAFVGHAADELQGARQAGMATVAVLYEPGARADFYAESLVDLLDVPIFESSHRKGAGE